MNNNQINTIRKKNETKRRSSLKSKIIKPVTVIILIAGTLAAMFTFTQTKNAFSEREKGALDQVTHGRAQEIITLIDEKKGLVKSIANNESLIEDIFTNSSNIENQIKMLERYNFNDEYLAIYVMDATGNTLVSTDLNFIGQNYGFRKYFSQAMKEETNVHTAVGVTSKQLGYYFSTPLKMQGEIIGVLTLKLNPNVIENLLNKRTHEEDQLLSNNDITTKMEFLLTDENGVILHSTDKDKVFKTTGTLSQDTKMEIVEDRTYEKIELEPLPYKKIQEAIEANKIHEHLIVNDIIDNRNEIVISVKVGDFPFFVLSETDLSEITTIASKNALILGTGVLGAAISTLIILILIIAKTIKPLSELGNTIKKSKTGDNLNLKDLEIKTNDEIEDIGKAIKDLAEELILEKKMVETQIELQTKQLQEQKTALMNVLDDVQIEKDIAKGAADELEKFKLATDNVSEHIVITDPEGFILYGNKAVEKITGYPIEEILGKKAGSKDLWGGNMPKNFYAELWYTIKEKKEVFSGEIKNRRKNGEEYIAYASINPVLDDNNNVIFFVGIERDITKEKEIDRMKTEFISLASHQLRTPLSAMKWFLEMLIGEEAGKLTKTQKEFLHNVDQSNERMIDLVNSLLNVSRIESGKIVVDPIPTDMNELLQQLLKELEEKLKHKKIKFTLDVQKEIPNIRVDPKLVRHVYLNLLTNAIKYTPEKGEITLKVSQEKEQLLTEIKDTGYGIPEKEKGKVFSKFFRGENIISKDTDGNGLGLYMVKAIVDSSKGSIWFETEENKGTTFWFTLPMEGMEPKEGVVTLQE